MARKKAVAAKSAVVEPVAVELPAVPEIKSAIGRYVFEYFNSGELTWYGRLSLEGDLLFSTWLCPSMEDVKALLVSVYHAKQGLLEEGEIELPIELVAAYPLNKILYPGGENAKAVGESIVTNGDLTDLFTPTINPQGLVLSGNSRYQAVEANGAKTLIAKVTYKPESQIILAGNHQRVKQPLELFNEAKLQAIEEARKSGGKVYQSRIREIFQEKTGMSSGMADAVKRVADFLADAPETETGAIEKIANTDSATVAADILSLREASQKGSGILATRFQEMAKAKRASPLPISRCYEGIEKDVEAIRSHYTSESILEIARALMLASEEVRPLLIEAKVNGDARPMLKLMERIALDLQPDPEPEEETPTEQPAKSAKQKAPTYAEKMQAIGIAPHDCWIANKATAAALNKAIGGIADCDPFSEPDSNIQADRRITAVENAFTVEDWGGGIRAGQAIRIATWLPAKNPAMFLREIFERIEKGTIAEAAIVVETTVLFQSPLAGMWKSIPLAYIPVRADADGFGAEPSKYILSRPQFADQSEENWNDRAACYLIVYFGSEYDRFEKACGRWGAIAYNAKAARSLSAIDWRETDGGWLALYDGVQYEISYDGEEYTLTVDGMQVDRAFPTIDAAQKAAIVHLYDL